MPYDLYKDNSKDYLWSMYIIGKWDMIDIKFKPNGSIEENS